MRRLPVLVVSLVGLLLIAGLACDGSDDGPDGPTLTPEQTAPAEASPSPDASPQATEAPTAAPPPILTVTPPPGARLAIPPQNYFDFLVRLGSQQSFRNCSYDESSGLVDCTSLELGQIQLDPPVKGSGVLCGVAEREGELFAIQCISEEPAQATLYEVVE